MTCSPHQGFKPLAGAPPLHNLPYPRLGDLFTGRQEELDALSTGGTAAITRIARRIRRRGGSEAGDGGARGNRYSAAWFVRAD